MAQDTLECSRMMKSKEEVNFSNHSIGFLLFLGKYEYKDGRVYNGEWMNNLRHGRGVYNLGKSGLVYDGNFIKGVKEGQGRLTW